MTDGSSDQNLSRVVIDIYDSISRRSFLRIGGVSAGGVFGGLSLPNLLQADSTASSFLRDRSVVFLFMHGGPPQAETFDPKMGAPSEYRCFNGEIKTSVPGLTYGASLEKLARLADKTTVVRSFQPGDGNHNIKPLVSPYSLGANVGTLCSRLSGITDRKTGMPANAVLLPRAVDKEAQEVTKQFGDFSDTGEIGSAFAPFVPSGQGDLMENMRLHLPQTRIDDRRALLKSLDRFKRELDNRGTMEGIDKFNDQAYDVILGGVNQAFDLSKEDPRLLARYDTSQVVPPKQIDHRWNNHKNYRDHGQTLGKLMLLARRLCEHGSRFVTITSNFVWDFHADVNNATLDEGMRYVGAPYDHAVSAFIEDVEARGLSDKILLVTCGEMGRTPKINAKGGRDHWGRLGPLLLYGGGLNLGSVVGRSDAVGGEPNSQAVKISNLIATIFHSMFDVGQLRLEPSVPRPLMQLIESGNPIQTLV